LKHEQSRATVALASTGENLRPDVAEQLESYAAEAKARIESMVTENKVGLARTHHSNLLLLCLSMPLTSCSSC
jgi:hypothetical protein